MLTVIIDAGHGGDTKTGGSSPNNASGPTGILEKDLTLAVAKSAKQQMPQAIDTILTRSDDSNLGLWHRANIANRHRADIFISIHFNGFHNPKVQGTETYHYPGANAESQNLASIIQTQALSVTGYRDRGVKQGRYGVINPAYHFGRTAACLLEVSFLTNPADEIRLSKPAYIGELGQAIVDGCIDYLAGQYLGALTRPDPVNRAMAARSEPSLLPGDHEDAASENLALSGPQSGNNMSGHKDVSELEDVSGIGPVMAQNLQEAGIATLRALAALPDARVAALADRVGTSDNMLKDWRAQAGDLL